MHYIDSSNMGVDDNGNYAFTDGPPGTKVNAAFMQTLMKEITNVIENAGLSVLTKNTDTRDQLWQALQILGRPYDLIVSSQVVFNSMIERVGANHYQIKGNYKSIFVKNITGGYNTTSWLSGGDTWGYLDTNTCGHIEFESDAYIACANTAFYFNINTDDAIIRNVWVKGDGSSATITNSFQLAANRVNYINCKTSERYDETSAIVGFQGSATASHNNTSKYDSCSVFNQTNDTIGDNSGFYLCKNLVNCSVDTLTTLNAACTATGFKNCYNLTNCNATDFVSAGIAYGMYQTYRINNSNIEFISGSSAYGLYQCEIASNISIISITGNTTMAIGAYNCRNLNVVEVSGITSTTLIGRGFSQCGRISGCNVEQMTNVGGTGNIGFDRCDMISSCYVTFNDIGLNYGFYTCFGIVSCRASNIFSTTDDVYAFYKCEDISGCRAVGCGHTGFVAGKNAYAFNECLRISSCHALSTATNGGGGVAEGFHNCKYIAAVFPADNTNTLNDYVDTDEASVTNKYSTPVSADAKWD